MASYLTLRPPQIKVAEKNKCFDVLLKMLTYLGIHLSGIWKTSLPSEKALNLLS
ncbi:unnamed protein product [Acanthoscelides obtectus]|uniref:Uncharacterized protein n=1 Tax=Acanthoscelides obtectus TaxID=200917 RepID=A0A9P0PIH9_ACAOB|nr:unnamed protein product [Acanthoscelides obtectus]CAK1648273.1 hypothetical protein AOBTE_LOCUS15634 [Acanthoscelides obtectus]